MENEKVERGKRKEKNMKNCYFRFFLKFNFFELIKAVRFSVKFFLQEVLLT